ncbi:hypothetical protein JTB14_010136 [Gonioctena quinquepunctata]|nr:hypothetical protein JTB14_010136 [Gonioctena quinquepunctata]
MNFSEPNRPELYALDGVEFDSFIGLLLYTQIFEPNREDVLFSKDGTEIDVFRCTMSEERFLFILACLRFDNPDTRNDRKESNRTAAITYILETFVRNCQGVYTLSEHTCIGEILVSSRGRCSFKMYFPKKPAKYGLKVMALTDAENNYFYDGYLYSGKQSDSSILTQQEKKLSVPSQSVIRLTKPIAKSNRNVTVDNWFYSVEIAEKLTKRGLTHIQTAGDHYIQLDDPTQCFNGSDLPRRLWSKLNRVRTGCNKCTDSSRKWGRAESSQCDCGSPGQTIRHIISEFPYRSYDYDLEDFMKATPEAIEWLRNLDVDI